MVTIPQRPETRQAEALDHLFSGFNDSNAPGMIVAVRSGPEFIYRRGFGLASVQHGLANTPQTRIRFASITKQFTCLALMLLAEESKVDIDAPVSTYLPRFRGPAGEATLRQFMTHTSGLRCTLELGSIANGYAPQPRDWQEQAQSRQKGLQYDPGAEQLYCNGTFVAISDVIEKISGETFPDFTRRRIFEPLAMFDTDIVENDHEMVPGLASAHVRNGERWERPPVDTEIRGDGGIVSTVDDMLRWLAHLRGTKNVGTDTTWEELLAPATLASGFETTYAMGIKPHSYRGVEVFQHSGGLFGLNAQIISVPEHETDIVIAVNGAAASATQLAFSALDNCLSGKFSEAARRRARTADFGYLPGHHFAHSSGVLLSFGDVNGLLGLSQMHMLPAPVLYEDEQSVFALFEEIGFGPLVWLKSDLANFENDPDAGLPVTIAGKKHQMNLLEKPARPCTAILQAAAGAYFSEELDATVAISASEDCQVAIQGDYSGVRRFSAFAISDRHLGLVSEDGAERYSMEIDVAADGISWGLWIDTHRARRVRFDRRDGDRT